MAKNYELEKSKATGWWVWYCTDGSDHGGSATSKKEAKAAAKAACGTSGVVRPPGVHSVNIKSGYVTKVEYEDLDGVLQEWTPENDNGLKPVNFSWFFGFECTDDVIPDEEKVITMLKIWNVYFFEANTAAEIQSKYNLDPTQYQRLVDKQIQNVQIQISDDLDFTWNFPPI